MKVIEVEVQHGYRFGVCDTYLYYPYTSPPQDGIVKMPINIQSNVYLGTHVSPEPAKDPVPTCTTLPARASRPRRNTRKVEMMQHGMHHFTNPSILQSPKPC